MSRPESFILGVTVCALAAVLADAAQDPLFKVDVNLVRILATVRNPSGDLVGSLGKADFTVSDNGVPQEIAVFERQTEQPLSIALLVDHSLSTAKELRYEAESVSRFLRAIFSEGNPQDEVAFYTFSYDVSLRVGFTRRRERLEEAMKSLKAESGTSLYDAIYLVSHDMEAREGRRVLVLVTDGGDTTSAKKFQDALAAAQMADAVLYAILVVPITNDAGRNLGGENALSALAAGTAGRVFTPSVGPALDEAFADILRELRTQYFLGYYPRGLPATKERFHRLDVKVTNPTLRVNARSGYYELGVPSGATRPALVRSVPVLAPHPVRQPTAMEKAKPKVKTKPPDHTAEEAKYLRHLIEDEVPVAVRLRDNQEFRGTIEFYDVSFIRLTRSDGPNLFIFKHDIKYVAELKK